MLVKFRSDESMEKRGFVMSYRSYDTSNGKVFEKTGSSNLAKLATLDITLLNRGYYTVVRRYEFCVRVARTIFHE